MRSDKTCVYVHNRVSSKDNGKKGLHKNWRTGFISLYFGFGSSYADRGNLTTKP